jgi:hyperosmotically inducible periplasmic protein
MNTKLWIILGLMIVPVTSTLAMSSHKAIQPDSVGQYVDNNVITLKIKSKLLTDPDTRGLGISVMSDRGRIKLKGIVDTEAQKQKAENLAKQVEGVTNVDNEISIKK